jgi:glucokinase
VEREARAGKGEVRRGDEDQAIADPGAALGDPALGTQRGEHRQTELEGGHGEFGVERRAEGVRGEGVHPDADWRF